MTLVSAAVGMVVRQLWRLRHQKSFRDRGLPRRPRVLIDVSEIVRHDAQTGIQRVVRAILSELERASGDDYDVLPVYATKTRGYCYAPRDFLETHVRQLGKIPVGTHPGDRFLGLDLAAHILPKHLDQLRAWRANGVSVHLVVYDLLPLQRHEWFSEAMSRNFRQWFNALTEIADQALCISDQVAADLRDMIAGTPAAGRLAIGRLHMGADIVASVPSRGRSDSVTSLFDRSSDRPFVLMVGTIEPRKAYDLALAAFDDLWSTQASGAPDLVIVGRPGWKTADFQRRLKSHRFLGQKLFWLPDASDEALGELYERCHGVFLASHGEGFGLPVIEAALHRRHALVRDLPVFKEKQLPNLLFFSDDKPVALAKKLMDLVGSPQSAPSASKLPSWCECTNGLIRALGLPHRRDSGLREERERQVA